ncbi:MAG: helicase C-terminal domain-containing protein [Planctomycetota bacterium]
MSQRVQDFLAPDGPVAALLGGDHEERPQQLQMAGEVAGAMHDRDHLLAEAGTGVGKSFAYLVPALERCLIHGERVVVSTNTISLQEQLMEKDIPLLQRALAERPWDDAVAPLKPVLVKGRGNYVSIRRLKLASSKQDRLFAESAERRTLHGIEDWAYDTPDGTLSSLPQLERPAVWDRVQSDSGNCMGRRCPHHKECFYQSARREMEEANLLVCNHALFFSDLALRANQAGFLPTYHHVVLDEAHMVEDVASEHFGRSLSQGRVRRLLTTLFHPRTRKGFLAQLGPIDGDHAPVDRAIELALAADTASTKFFDEAADVVRRAASGSAGSSGSSGPASVRFREAGQLRNQLSDAMNQLAVRLKRLKDSTERDADRFELNAYALRAASIADDALALTEHALPGQVYWGEIARSHGGRERVTLACSPIDVAPILRERLFALGDDPDHPDRPSVVLTSATLATRTAGEDEPSEHREAAFTHVISRLGCDGARALQLGSPFDHARQLELYVDVSMANPRQASGEGAQAPRPFYEQLVARILDHLVATDGGAFVLFTSFAALNAVADRLAGPLEALEMPLFAQGRDVSRTELLDRFRDHDRAVLLGAASFWQGVDVRGAALRNVIITKLPFDPPDRPLTQARLERIREGGGDPFRQESLPRAVIRFKQGFGRLIRSAEDTGRVVVLDPRVATASYGRAFLNALPSGIEPIVLDE